MDKELVSRETLLIVFYQKAKNMALNKDII